MTAEALLAWHSLSVWRVNRPCCPLRAATFGAGSRAENQPDSESIYGFCVQKTGKIPVLRCEIRQYPARGCKLSGPEAKALALCVCLCG